MLFLVHNVLTDQVKNKVRHSCRQAGPEGPMSQEDNYRTRTMITPYCAKYGTCYGKLPEAAD